MLIEALLVFWKGAVISIGNSCVKICKRDPHTPTLERASLLPEAQPHVSQVSNMSLGTRAGVRGHSTSLRGYMLQPGTVRSEISES